MNTGQLLNQEKFNSKPTKLLTFKQMFRGEEIERGIRPPKKKKAAGEGGAWAPTSPSPGARSVFAEIIMCCGRIYRASSDSSLKTYPSRDLLVL